ncbi:MAG: hypothetical protein JWM88_3189 [Verrucomicrobia bacterium]|nr:hypothetical protein [Verrucomicrobiota bacterium]
MRRVWPMAGFTLVEVLVSAAITVLIAGVLFGIAGSAVTSWTRLQGVLETEAAAGRALDELSDDLEGALCFDDESVSLAISIQPGTGISGNWVDGEKPVADSLVLDADSLVDARFGVAGVWLRLFTTRRGKDPRTSDPAAPVAVGYQLIRREMVPGNAAPRYFLYRAEVTAAATQTAGFALDGEAYATASSADGEAGNLLVPPVRRVIAENVIDFGAWLYSRETDPETGRTRIARVFPQSAGSLDYQVTFTRGAGAPMPGVVDVMLRILTDEGARKIAALEAGKISGDWWSIANAHSRVFTRRIAVRGSGLP